MRSTFYTKKSKINGTGCFTEIDLEPGMRFPIHAVEVYEDVEQIAADEDIDPHAFYDEETDRWFIPIGPFAYLNHARRAKGELVCEDGVWYLEIIRCVTKGREVTIDYGDEWE